ncbi:MAG: cupredoxin domain-containing protein [Parcubacteria group bacterium]|nr:cupredoxin domain-containing protein [Parcubacteria group bacterium]
MSYKNKTTGGFFTGLIGIIVILIIIIIGYYFIKSKSVYNDYQTKTSEETKDSALQTVNVSNGTNNGVSIGTSVNLGITRTFTVNYTDAGFNPNTLEINGGDIVRFVNQSNGGMDVSSNPHPSHTDYPAFNENATVNAGGTFEFTFDQAGTWSYHNHLRPNLGGTITVK